jgi:hypothetical protein
LGLPAGCDYWISVTWVCPPTWEGHLTAMPVAFVRCPVDKQDPPLIFNEQQRDEDSRVSGLPLKDLRRIWVLDRIVGYTRKPFSDYGFWQFLVEHAVGFQLPVRQTYFQRVVR